MFKHISYCAFFASCVALLLTAGCATHDIVKKDESIPPVAATKTADVPHSFTPPVKQNALPAVTQVPPSQAPITQISPKISSRSDLQSALQTIYFDFDSSNLSELSRGILSKNASALAQETAAKVRIEGNCDERGSAEYNLALGERRAKAAQLYLVSLGVSPSRLSVISYGKEKTAVQGNEESVWAKNRRDEFVVVTK